MHLAYRGPWPGAQLGGRWGVLEGPAGSSRLGDAIAIHALQFEIGIGFRYFFVFFSKGFRLYSVIQNIAISARVVGFIYLFVNLQV